VSMLITEPPFGGSQDTETSAPVKRKSSVHVHVTLRNPCIK
jgi:hypothetical protein